MITSEQKEELLKTLQSRFEKHRERHPDQVWENVLTKLVSNEGKLRSLFDMERTGGEPDVVEYDPLADAYVFYDCSAESPAGRRSICYDREALEARKEHKPQNNALDLASDMGIEILTEEQYRRLQKIGTFDLKTSSWIKTPDSIRKLGGALFCDRRYDMVFVYHNGADSYYSARGFRGSLEVS